MTAETGNQNNTQTPALWPLTSRFRTWRFAICAALLLIGMFVLLFVVQMERRRKAAGILRQAGYDLSVGSRQSFLGHYGRSLLGVEVFESYLEHLSDVPSMSVHCLSFDGGCRIAHCDQLLLFPEIEQLWVGSDEIPDALFQAASRLPNLRRISLNGGSSFHAPVITAEAMRQMARAKTLESVEFRDVVISDEDLAFLAELPTLREISVTNVPFSGSAFIQTRWKSADTLNTLLIDQCSEFGAASVSGLQQFENLRSLNLTACPKVVDDLWNEMATTDHAKMIDAPPVFKRLETINIRYGWQGYDLVSVFGDEDSTLAFLDAQPAIQEVFGLPHELFSPRTGRAYTNRFGK